MFDIGLKPRGGSGFKVVYVVYTCSFMGNWKSSVKTCSALFYGVSSLRMPGLHHRIQSIGGHTSSPRIPRLYRIQGIDHIKMADGLDVK